jgi:cyanophycin synthetase
VQSSWQLARAVASASVYGTRLIIQSHISGDNYRLLYLEGQLLDAVVLQPPTVTGDGHHTVRSLVERVNAERLQAGVVAGQRLISIDFDMHRTLSAQGLTLDSVALDGQQVTIKTTINENSGSDTRSAKHLICESIDRLGAEAAAIVGARMAGVDIITRDPSVPLATFGGAVIEVNTTPGFYWHYAKSDGAFPVAKHVLERLLPTAALPPTENVADGIAADRGVEGISCL